MTIKFMDIKAGQTINIKGMGRRAAVQTFTAESDATADQFCANGTTYKVLTENGETCRLGNGLDNVELAK